MAKRANDMATIDLALSGELNQPATTEPVETPDLPIAPGVNAPALVSDQVQKPKLTADEKRAFDAARIQELDRQKLLDEAMAAEQAEKDAFKQNANATVRAAQNIVREGGARLGSIPTPGGLALPISILLFFFFLLVPVNGHTRLTWLWLVLSGNASVSSAGLVTPGASSSGGETGSGNTANPGTPVLTPPGAITIPTGIQTLPDNSISLLTQSIPLSFTGVEDQA